MVLSGGGGVGGVLGRGGGVLGEGWFCPGGRWLLPPPLDRQMPVKT